MFLGADRAMALATQVHELYQVINRDYADLTPNQRAELIAERVAGILPWKGYLYRADHQT